ncbi:hypothetical protein LINPERPRIM_LOCUS24871 [Linum perenne]
MEARLH